MAERRMFAKTIIDSDAFMDMPVTARLLYYDLGMRADDDGFVNSPKKITRMIGASEDDLKILCAKKFIIPFENGVVVIKHWLIHNYVRKDTYHETKYKELKALLEYDENNSYRLKNDVENISVDGTSTARRRHVDDTLTQDRLGKDRLGKDRLGKDNGEESARDEKINYQLIADMYNETCVSFPKLTILSDDRKKAIKARLNKYSVADFQTMFTKAEASDFLKGANNRNWTATFDWMIKDANMAKILDGNFDNKSGQAKAVKSYRDMSPTERLAQELDESYEMMRQWVNESEG